MPAAVPSTRLSPFLVPGAHSFAALAGLEAFVRGTVLSAFPLLMYRAFGDAALVSRFYFLVGLCALAAVLATPMLIRAVPRYQVMIGGISLYLVAAACGLVGGRFIGGAVLFTALAASVVLVCFSAYVLDYIGKSALSELEAKRLLYSGLGWTAGPFLGVWLMDIWPGLPFLVTGLAAALMLALLIRLNPGNGRVIQRAASVPAPGPLTYISRFLSQPRLVAGWTFTLVRSCGWWVFFVYVGIFAVESGLPQIVGGITASAANAGLFLAPLMLVWMKRQSVRTAVRVGFLTGAAAFLLGAALAPWPWAAIAVLTLGTLSLVLLDVCGGLPFMMSVKPSERTEMSAVYSSFRDVSGILTPGIAWVVLHIAPLPALFAVSGLAMLGAWLVAARLHPRLGITRPSRGNDRPAAAR